MPNLDLNLPVTPLPATAPTPVAAQPTLPAEGGEGEAFAAMIAVLGGPRAPDAPAVPFKPSIGNIMPPQGQDFAAPLPPPVQVEQVMIGSTAAVPTPIADPAAPVLPPPLPTQSGQPAPLPAVAMRIPAEDGPTPQPALPAEEPAVPAPGQRPWVLRATSSLTPTQHAPQPLLADAPRFPVEIVHSLPVAEAPAPGRRLVPAVTSDPTPVLSEGPDGDEAVPQDAPPSPLLSLAPTIFTPTCWTPHAAPVAEPAPSGDVAASQVVLPKVQLPLLQPLPPTPAEAPAPDAAEPLRSEAPLPAAPQPVAATVRSDPAPAAQPAFSPELIRQLAQVVRQATESSAATAPVLEAPTETTAPAPQPVAAPTAAPTIAAPQLPPVNIARSDWMQAMIERIAEMPQADGAREARIRLLPDALGKIDVQIVQRDERMHVTLTADAALTRQLLSEAAPRLQELAEARGLRFAQTDVAGGQPQDRRSAPEQQPSTPLRPRSADSGAAIDPQPDGELIA